MPYFTSPPPTGTANAGYCDENGRWVTTDPKGVKAVPMTLEHLLGRLTSISTMSATAATLRARTMFSKPQLAGPIADRATPIAYIPVLGGEAVEVPAGGELVLAFTWQCKAATSQRYLDAGVVLPDGTFVNYTHAAPSLARHSGDLILPERQVVQYIRGFTLQPGQTAALYVNVYRNDGTIADCGPFSFMALDATDREHGPRHVFVAQPMPAKAQTGIVAHITRDADTHAYVVTHARAAFNRGSNDSSPTREVVAAVAAAAF